MIWCLVALNKCAIPPVQMDFKKLRQAQRGKMRPERRIDLQRP